MGMFLILVLLAGVGGAPVSLLLVVVVWGVSWSLWSYVVWRYVAWSSQPGGETMFVQAGAHSSDYGPGSSQIDICSLVDRPDATETLSCSSCSGLAEFTEEMAVLSASEIAQATVAAKKCV